MGGVHPSRPHPAGRGAVPSSGTGRPVKIECGVDGLDGAPAAALDAVLLDDMGPDLLARAAAASGVDLAPIGRPTHSAPGLDIGLDHRS